MILYTLKANFNGTRNLSLVVIVVAVVIVVVVSVCVSWSDDRVTGILENSVCWWNHLFGTPQLMEVAVVGSMSPLPVCVHV
jgi:hypothetical protein